MPEVISFWPTSVFYLLTIRLYVPAINNCKMLLTSVKKIITQGSPCWSNQPALPPNWYWDERLNHASSSPFSDRGDLSPFQGELPPRTSKAYFVHTAHTGSLWQGPYCSLWCYRSGDSRAEMWADCPRSSYVPVSDCSWLTPWSWVPGPQWEGREHSRSEAGAVPRRGWSEVPLPAITGRVEEVKVWAETDGRPDPSKDLERPTFMPLEIYRGTVLRTLTSIQSGSHMTSPNDNIWLQFHKKEGEGEGQEGRSGGRQRKRDYTTSVHCDNIRLEFQRKVKTWATETETLDQSIQKNS